MNIEMIEFFKCFKECCANISNDDPKKEQSFPFDISNTDLETMGMDLLNYLLIKW